MGAMNAENTNSNHVHPMDLLLVVVLCIAFFGYRLGSFVPLTDHEGYVAVTAQETLEGHWLIPYYDGQIRLQKTPLMYWSVAGLATIFDRLDEIIIRLPSALAASGIAIFLTILGARMFTRVTGVMIGLAMVGSTGMLWQSHVGTADMLMSFFVVACMAFVYFALVRIEEGRSEFWNLVLAYVTFGLAMLAKGPVPVIAVLIPLFVYLVWAGLANRWEKVDSPIAFLGAIFSGFWGYLKKIHLLPGLVIVLAIIGAWVVPVLVQLPDAYYRWKAEYFERYLGDFGTERAWWYYLPQIFLLTLPWSVFLPVGLLLPFRRALKGKRHELMFLFMWLVVGFVLFSISGGKRAHYILPILPPAVMLSVAGMIYALEHWLSWRTVLVGSAVVIIVTILGFGLSFSWVKERYSNISEYYRILAIILVFAELLAMLVYFRLNLLAAVTVISLTAGIIFAMVWPLVPRVMDSAHDPKPAAERIRQIVGSNATIYFIGKAQGPLIFYYGRKMPQILEDQEVVEVFKSKNARQAMLDLQVRMAERAVDLIRRPECVYFITSDVHFPVAQAYARRAGAQIYEILRIPRFFSEDKGMVLFSNCAKPARTGNR